MHYVPTAPVTIQEINGIGPVEVGSNFMYIPTTFLPEIKQLISKSVDLQKEVCLFRELLWTRYGHSDEKPPFDPQHVKSVCNDAGATTLFEIVLNAMTTTEHTAGRRSLNDKNVVAVLYMLVFGQSKKASLFERVLSDQVVGRGISETGLFFCF